MKKNEKGFSLVELLVVVIIIAIVAAIAIPNLLASRRAANEASAISSLRTIHSAEATYQATIGGNVNYGDAVALGTAGGVGREFWGAAAPKKGVFFFVSGVSAHRKFCSTKTYNQGTKGGAGVCGYPT